MSKRDWQVVGAFVACVFGCFVFSFAAAYLGTFKTWWSECLYAWAWVVSGLFATAGVNIPIIYFAAKYPV